MQSGKARTKEWVLDYEPEVPREIEPLMGWTASGDMRQQVRLYFDTAEEAVAYCERHGIAYQVSNSKPVARHTISYADNFSYQRRDPWISSQFCQLADRHVLAATDIDDFRGNHIFTSRKRHAEARSSTCKNSRRGALQSPIRLIFAPSAFSLHALCARARPAHVMSPDRSRRLGRKDSSGIAEIKLAPYSCAKRMKRKRGRSEN